MMAARPVADVLGGLEVDELQPGDTPLEAVVIIKVLPADPDAGTTWAYRSTPGIEGAEELGALFAALDSARRSFAWIDE
jgi:hypothetical protein